MAGESANRLNKRARKAVTDALGGVPIESVVAFSHLSGGGANSDGVVGGGSSILGSSYAVERGINLDDPRLRSDLLQAWCALTPNEMVFFKASPWAVIPKPGPLLDRIDRAGTTLRWVDVTGQSTVSRMIHLEFPDGRLLLTSTLVRARLRRKNYSDEPDLFISAFGAAATEVAAD